MSRSYRDELAGLPAAYAAALAVSGDEIDRLRAELSGGPSTFVGAGGTLSCAKFGATLHERLCGSMSRAATPLEVAIQPPPDYSTVVLISARARHPDTAAAAAAALATGNRRILLLTQRPREELSGSLADPHISYHRVPIPDGGYDGFLATGSLLAIATLLVRAYSTKPLPASLPSFKAENISGVRNRLLVLNAPGTEAPAHDLEARFNETGLADVELTDFRNFGHGRHYGFSRRIEQTTVVTLSTRETEKLASRTLAVLPHEAHIIRLHSDLQWPVSVLDLLVQSAQLVQPAARQSNINPAKPKVPAFGRRLYHLSPGTLSPHGSEPIQRKIREVIAGGPYEDIYQRYDIAFRRWHSNLRETVLAGLILDYDGTVCATRERYSLPRKQVRLEIERLLHSGMKIGFASGRGTSLYKDLREWVPESQWGQLLLGLYSGALIMKLSDDLPTQDDQAPIELRQAFDRLQEEQLADLLELRLRKHQLTVKATGSTKLNTETLAGIVSSVLSRNPKLPVSVLTSGHSIDVVRPGVAKTLVHEALAASTGGGKILAIGDQGQVGGNDHTLLAYSEYTLSVDRCSPDPTRCWNIAGASERGPDGLVRYLKAIKLRRDSNFQFVWGSP